jgi:hypothetical protein
MARIIEFGPISVASMVRVGRREAPMQEKRRTKLDSTPSANKKEAKGFRTAQFHHYRPAEYSRFGFKTPAHESETATRTFTGPAGAAGVRIDF